MEVVFWISACILFYVYLGYGLLLFLLSTVLKKQALPVPDVLAPVTLVVPAYNEEAIIAKKIQNCFALSYPKQLLTILFVTDGSTDDTAGLVASHPEIIHLHQPERKGKTAALNRAMQQVATPFVVFSDANALLHPDSIQNLLRHYSDPMVGGVSGEKRIAATDATAVGIGERIYWQYESMLKKADAVFYTVIGAAGELFSIRTELFEPLEENIILDDFVLSARICQKGYRFTYDRNAYATEGPSETIAEEQQRKIRISAGCFQALVLLKASLNPFRNWRLTFQYVSHKVLRWTLCPLLVPLLFLSNAVLAVKGDSIFYFLFFVIQCSFYAFALLGWRFSGRRGFPKPFLIPYYFVFMNLSLYVGFCRFLTGRQSAVWKRSARRAYPNP
ncbi:MAG TPA: glycosyltransferase family 2 protein [Flavisolibacter sp.]|jgi:cellulose synthase/poly-beta-1,6-N-acetylglucosamine synthase-like glycosyltransferase|nr:glycosyltransferase family 2 protein [Flavisolibacter sp.]